MKKTNNKGFSLVELIIVIAIMAVLIAVLAPQFLRYVERSRLQSDNTAIGEIANACKIAATNEAVAAGVAAGDITVTITVGAPAAVLITAGGNAAGLTALNTELIGTIPTAALTSNTYVTGTDPTVVMHLDTTTNTIQVWATSYVPAVGIAAETTHMF